MDPITTLSAPIITGLTTGLGSVLCIAALIVFAIGAAKVVNEHYAGHDRTGRGLLADVGGIIMGPGILALTGLGLILVPAMFV